MDSNFPDAPIEPPGLLDSANGRRARIRIWALVIVIPALCCGIAVLRLLAAAGTDMNVPVVYERDALEKLAIFKGIGEGNLSWRNPHLAAPFGSSDWRDYPLYQWIDYSAFRVSSLFNRNSLKLLNFYWILTIMVTAATAAFAFQRLRVSPMVAGCLAFLYGMQPYVFVRNIGHINTVCYLVPLLGAACLEVATGRWETDQRPSFREIPIYAWAGFILQGISFFYHSFFGALLLGVAALYGACARRSARPLIHSAWLIVALAVASLVGVSPTILHWARDGKNTAAVGRMAAEADLHGLRIRQLLTPVPEHPLAFMRKLSDIATAAHQDRNEGDTARLGLLGSAGFVALLAYIFAILAGWKFELDDGVVAACAALLLAALLLCTVGGFGSIFNTFISPIVRAYARIVVFILFFILASYGAVVTAFLNRKSWTRRHPLAVSAVLASITAVAFADELWSPHGIQAAGARQSAASDRAFVSSIEKVLGGHGMIYQLPYTDYPASDGPGKIVSYDEARPYIQSSADLQWSWGAVPGTKEASWEQGIALLPPENLLWEVQKKGFRGLFIDTFGYSDDVSRSPAKAISKLLGREPIASQEGRFLFFDLTSAHVLSPTALAGSTAPFTASEIHPGGECNVDSVNGINVTGAVATAQRDSPFHINGWAADTDTGVVLPDIYVEVTDAGGQLVYLRGSRMARGDVVSHFNKPSLLKAGFVAGGVVEALAPGYYRVRILQAGPDRVEACAVGFHLKLR